MRQATLGVILAVLLGMMWIEQGASQARADKAFRDRFVARYVKADSNDAKDKTFAAVVEKAKCTICHEGKSKKNRNTYGKALAELLSRKTYTENTEKIEAALKKVEAKHFDPKNEKSPTFGEIIKSGKLPVEPKG